MYNKRTVISFAVCVVIVIIVTLVLADQLSDRKTSLNLDSSKVLAHNQTNQCQGTALCITEKIRYIIDGDTIHLEDGHRVRISLTNTPEIYQNGYNEATQFTENLCPVGSVVLVDQDDMQPYDRFNRLLGKVTCGDKILNSELLYNAHANVLTQYCTTSEFAGEPWAIKYGC